MNPQVILGDGGQPYTETNLRQFIAEPWNFVTAGFFVILALYWLFKIRKKIRHHSFLFAMVILLMVGAIGGTFYHGFRCHRIFLMMDWMPIMLITFSGSFYFFIKSWGNWWLPTILIIVYFFFQALIFQSGIPVQSAINISYASMSVIVLLPVIWYLIKTGWRNFLFVLFALLSFCAALFFRWADKFVWLPMGTHFLWHIFGLLAVHLMLEFLFLSREN